MLLLDFPPGKKNCVTDLKDGMKDIINCTRRGEAVEERVEILLKQQARTEPKAMAKRILRPWP